MPQVSFAADIRPLFRAVDISHMNKFGVKLDDYTYMSNPNNANTVLANLSSHNGERPSMPPGGPYWNPAQLALFAQWQKDGNSTNRQSAYHCSGNPGGMKGGNHVT